MCKVFGLSASIDKAIASLFSFPNGHKDIKMEFFIVYFCVSTTILYSDTGVVGENREDVTKEEDSGIQLYKSEHE